MIENGKPFASLSLDLDNEWSYLKTHGDASWRSYPSYLNLFIPRLLDFLSERGLSITVFVVGQDAALAEHREAMAALAAGGHEIGNHSFKHEPWLHEYSESEVEEEIASAEHHIGAVTNTMPLGFRAPGFCLSTNVLRVLERRGYVYDATSLPTVIGPVARAYYLLKSNLTQGELSQRARLFGRLRDGLHPIKPYAWKIDDRSLIEIPVTTLPIFKLPIHVSYLLYLSTHSVGLATRYFATALRLCRWSGWGPSLLLHPLDFLGGEEVRSLAFFPAMSLSTARKVELVDRFLGMLSRWFMIGTVLDHARRIQGRPDLPVRQLPR